MVSSTLCKLFACIIYIHNYVAVSRYMRVHGMNIRVSCVYIRCFRWLDRVNLTVVRSVQLDFKKLVIFIGKLDLLNIFVLQVDSSEIRFGGY